MRRLCVLLLLSGIACGGELLGTIGKSVKLSSKSGPYSVPMDVLISRGATVLVPDGVVLNFGTSSEIEAQGRLVLLGKKESPIIVNGGSIEGHITARGVKFARCSIEPERRSTDTLGFKEAHFDAGSLYFGYDCRNCVVSECTFNGTNVYGYSSSYYYYRDRIPRIEGSMFAHCSIELELLANASHCVFINCTFDVSGSIYLPKDTAVTTCYFDTTSLVNVMRASKGAQYRKGRLFVKQGKKPKKMPDIPGTGLGSKLREMEKMEEMEPE
jgi:hypothetical protein